jgi:hypothetical protein
MARHGFGNMPYFGSRAQVMNGNAKMTTGRLSKKDLMYNKHGRIVSKKKFALAKKTIKKNLFAKGFKPKKGKFTAFKKSDATKKRSRKSRK